MRGKRGELLTENVIFLVLNIAFFALLLAFIILQGSGFVNIEESYAKQIALLVDSASPGMEITLDLHDGATLDAEWFSLHYDESVRVEGNEVLVTFHEDGGSSYHFFNDVAVATEVDPFGKLYLVVRGKHG